MFPGDEGRTRILLLTEAVCKITPIMMMLLPIVMECFLPILSLTCGTEGQGWPLPLLLDEKIKEVHT
jgi:hypothetical protein